MARLGWSLGRLIARTHALFALVLLLLVVVVMASQVARRQTFADTELYDDVMDRWGTPIVQGAPSVRFVEHGTVFRKLEAMPLTRQHVTVTAAMNYRKRGLVYFSGFDFAFDGDYAVRNDHDFPIDVAFVFPISVQRDRVLLSDLTFAVDGQPAPISLQGADDKLLWTGRVEPGAEVDLRIGYRGRGLDSFVYALDPSLPVRGLDVQLDVTGGSNHDYPEGVVPATTIDSHLGGVTLHWVYDALEAGVPLGAILPSQQGFDQELATMIWRAPAPFLLFFLGLVALQIRHARPLRPYEAGLVFSAYLFFYVLLPYLAAFLNFWVALVLALAVIGGLLVAYVDRLFGADAVKPFGALLVASLLTPTIAVLAEGYTGLIYTLELLALLGGLMYATTRPGFQAYVEGFRSLAAPREVS